MKSKDSNGARTVFAHIVLVILSFMCPVRVCQVKCVSSKIFLIGDHILVANLAYKIKCFTF